MSARAPTRSRRTSQSSARRTAARRRRAVIAAQDVLRHRAPGDVEARLVQAGEQEAGVAVAHVELAARGIGQVGQRRLGDPVGAIAAAREPHRVDRRVGHDLAQRGEPRLVRPGEMAVGQKALRVNDELAVAALGDDRLRPPRRPRASGCSSGRRRRCASCASILLLTSRASSDQDRPRAADHALAGDRRDQCDREGMRRRPDCVAEASPANLTLPS